MMMMILNTSPITRNTGSRNLDQNCNEWVINNRKKNLREEKLQMQKQVRNYTAHRTNSDTAVQFCLFTRTPQDLREMSACCVLCTTSVPKTSALVSVQRVTPQKTARTMHVFTTNIKCYKNLFRSCRVVTYGQTRAQLKAMTKLSLCTPWKHQAGAAVQLHSFLTSAEYGVQRSASRPGRFTPEK